MTLVSGELQDSINRVRMLPLSALFNLFPRLLRDIARQEGKEIELVVEGGQAQLDKKIIEELKDPLTHLLRNALDHGIEKPEDRLRAGKRPAGRLRLSATQKATQRRHRHRGRRRRHRPGARPRAGAAPRLRDRGRAAAR